MNITKALATGVSLIALLSATTASAETLAEIEAAAKKEGMLTTIALPHDWCNYGEIIASFNTGTAGAPRSRVSRFRSTDGGLVTPK